MTPARTSKWIASACWLIVSGWMSSSTAETPALIGSSSCATSTCHAQVSMSTEIWPRSFTMFLARDPHATAGLLLRDQDSRRIVERLNPQAIESAAAFDEVLRRRCIACHTTATPQQCESDERVDDAFLAAGVSCESCHGPASEWIDQHTRHDWYSATTTVQDRERVGFRDNELMLTRHENCVRCHVGSRREDGLVRDVNHDLIAAGHPALRFDSLIYNRNLPAHWDQTQSHEQDFYRSSVRLRKSGRAIALATAAKLAGQRAEDHIRERTAVPWPELADFDCFACHHVLSTRSYRLPADQVQRSQLHVSNGLPVWNAWYTTELLNLRDKPDWLRELSPQQSNPQTMARVSLLIAERCRQIAIDAVEQPVSLSVTLGETVDRLRLHPPLDWHAAAVAFLSIQAVIEDHKREGSNRVLVQRIESKLPNLEKLLQFPYASNEEPTVWQSPYRFRPETFQKTAIELFE